MQDPEAWAWQWYARSPAVGVLLWPPLFQGALGLAFALGGPSLVSGQILVLGFLVLAAWAWFRLGSRELEWEAGILCALLLIASPAIVFFAGLLMLEIPSLALASAAWLFFWRYERDGARWPIYLAGLLAGLALLTKAQAIFLGPAVLLAVAASRRKRALLKDPHAWGAAGLVLVVALPYYVPMLLLLGPVAADNALAAPETPLGWADPMRYLFYLGVLPEHLGWPLTVAATGAALAAPFLMGRRALPGVAWILGVWLTMTFFALKDPRYALYWVPGWTWLIGGTCAELMGRLSRRRLAAGVLGLLVAAQLVWGATHRRPLLVGYEEAARWIVEHHRPRSTVLFHGPVVPTFLFGLRRVDPEGGIVTLRSDKVLEAHRITEARERVVLAGDEEAMLALFRRYGVRHFVVAEPPEDDESRVMKNLRAVLAEPRFRRVHRVALRSSDSRLDRMRLVLYEDTAWKPMESEVLELEMLTLGKTVKVPLTD